MIFQMLDLANIRFGRVLLSAKLLNANVNVSFVKITASAQIVLYFYSVSGFLFTMYL